MRSEEDSAWENRSSLRDSGKSYSKRESFRNASYKSFVQVEVELGVEVPGEEGRRIVLEAPTVIRGFNPGLLRNYKCMAFILILAAVFVGIW